MTGEAVRGTGGRKEPNGTVMWMAAVDGEEGDEEGGRGGRDQGWQERRKGSEEGKAERGRGRGKEDGGGTKESFEKRRTQGEGGRGGSEAKGQGVEGTERAM